MSTNASLFPYAATGVTAFALVAALLVWPELARAVESQAPAAATGCLCPRSAAPDAKPSATGARIELDQNDEYAALESLQLALSEVADGQSYVWRRSHGRLSGIVKPLSSFKDTHGSVCRHAAVVLTGVAVTKRTEIVACRLPTGVWQLES
jgi:surface antigen